jgi:hypothetical protein
MATYSEHEQRMLDQQFDDGMRRYRVTDALNTNAEIIEARTGADARKVYAAKHKIGIFDCIARWMDAP